MRRAAVPAVVIGGLYLMCAAGARAQVVEVETIGTVGDDHVVMPTYSSPDRAVSPVAAGAVGDVNGDGLDDSALSIESFEPSYAPTVWVSFASETLPSTRAAGGPGWRGIRIVGGQFQQTMAGVDDMNGDGLDDVAVYDWTTNTLVVVFGRVDTATVDVGDLGSAGFRITDVDPRDLICYGHVSIGSACINTSVTGVGDQNGDGRPELAFADGDDVRVAYAPATPAGATLDADALGTGGYTLETHETERPTPKVGRLGDLDGDGREELMVAWNDEPDPITRVVGLSAPPPGSSVDLRTAADGDSAFELTAPGWESENAVAVGDQNGDGRRDVVLVASEEVGSRSLIIANTPQLGVRRDITPAVPGESVVDPEIAHGNVYDVGDQDGDGIADLAVSDWIRLSRSGRFESAVEAPAQPFVWPPEPLRTLTLGMIVGSLADRNEDDIPELLTVYALPHADQEGAHTATWQVNTYLSAMTPLPEIVEPPVPIGGELVFNGSFITASAGRARSVAGLGGVELTRPDGSVVSAGAGRAVDAGARRTEVAVPLDAGAAGLVPGARYTFRLMLANNRGRVGSSAASSFVYRPAERPHTTGPARRSCAGAPRAALRLAGGPRGERLVGGSGPDRISARGGRDTVIGCAGRDRLNPGRGRDVVSAGRGADLVLARDRRRDVVRCGPGRDTVRADRSDRLSGCERVLPRRPRG